MREVIGRTPIQPALTELRAQIETDVLQPDPADPQQLQGRGRDHPGAAAEGRSAGRGGRKLPRRAARQHRCGTHAQRSRGLSQRHRAARAWRCRAHRRRGGRAREQAIDRPGHRPDAALPPVLAAYQAAEDVTLRRMYIETMQDILTHSPALVVDDKLKGLLPFLPLSPPNPAPRRFPAVPPAPTGGSARERHHEPRRDRHHRRVGRGLRAGGWPRCSRSIRPSRC